MSINVAGDGRSKVSGLSIDIEIGARCARTRSTPYTGGVTSKTYRDWRSMCPNEADAVHSVRARWSHRLDCWPQNPGPHGPIRTWARELRQHVSHRYVRGDAEADMTQREQRVGENAFCSLTRAPTGEADIRPPEVFHE